MSDMTIEEFCDHHKACKEGREWAIKNCRSMHDAWLRLRPDWLLWVATRPGVLTEKDLRRFAVHCARSVQHLLTDDRSKSAIAVAERYTSGEASDEELRVARATALDATLAAFNAARAASNAASAASDAAWAAWEAAWAAWEAACAARDAALDGQAKFIRESMTPSFARTEEAGNE